ncbi:hypothetical protein MRB53_022066 [Persea americana]|uniref:Uncharacterized protein n=1 Tax=Persea americana TaxID=3435 RepID=A0ACC2L5V3_PERAE|nr:hypothetical protein MRB53_022066 [Persea americana]
MEKGQLQYEEIRRKRLEENKKKLEDLNLTHLLHSLRNASSKPTHAKKGKPRPVRGNEANVEVRRSSRVANMPSPDYTGATVYYGEGTRTRRRSHKKRSLLSDKAMSGAVNIATEFQSSLDPEFPSFVKPFLQSHGSWLGLPREFCESHLPKDDATITLIDQTEDEHQTRYLARNKGFGAGWKDFSIAHELVDGDALVFQLIKATMFEVYIIRSSESSK